MVSLLLAQFKHILDPAHQPRNCKQPHVIEPSPILEDIKPLQANSSGSGTVSALCSAYPQSGAIDLWARPGVLSWTPQGQFVCHSSGQVTIAVSSS
jgi:hypothetical protein